MIRRKPRKILSQTPARKGVFQHPALVKLGEEISAVYERAHEEAVTLLMLKREEM